ncbi:hypothetical protein ORIO_04190 [Cereibacter azotoformans]|uniref:hypothetical protein n=1 Tax=Cereibacter azotoformans TaxID=43057 RepID=UPI001EEB34A1|nr:hypothetical protein [Cereibacter azotoformans]ULB09127.1 hypothetical protein ORIO_04190 [Cereibacter azotoformans]
MIAQAKQDYDVNYWTFGNTPAPMVWMAPAERVSALLGPDGEPLRVGFERPKMGFDLSPRK